jgi:hypothetical protein
MFLFLWERVYFKHSNKSELCCTKFIARGSLTKDTCILFPVQVSLWQTKAKGSGFLEFLVTRQSSNMPRACSWKSKIAFGNLSHLDLRTSFRYFCHVCTGLRKASDSVSENQRHGPYGKKNPRLHMFSVGCSKNWNTHAKRRTGLTLDFSNNRGTLTVYLSFRVPLYVPQH